MRPVCGAWMPVAEEHCARQPGHMEGRHLTRYALDNNYRINRGHDRRFDVEPFRPAPAEERIQA